MTKQINVAIIGCGSVAPAHIESYNRLDGVDVIRVKDKHCRKEERFAYKTFGENKKYPLFTTSDEWLWENVDAVSICTPHNTHADLVEQALATGTHVLCEKPIAHSMSDIDRICAAAAAHPELSVGICLQHRFDSALIYLRQLVTLGVFGDILTCGATVRCRRDAPYYKQRPWCGKWDEAGGGVTIHQAMHTIDALLWIMGDKVTDVRGMYANRALKDVIEVEDTAVATLKFENGALGTIETTSSCSIPWENTISIHGTEGSIELREGIVTKLNLRNENYVATILEDFAECVDEELIQNGKRYYGKTHPLIIQDFIESIREERQPIVTPANARHANEVVLDMYRAGAAKRQLSMWEVE